MPTLFKQWAKKLVCLLTQSELESTDDVTDNVEMDALCRALLVNVDVAYLNGGREDSVDLIQFHNVSSEDDQDPLVLLYRYVVVSVRKFILIDVMYSPGHYDILIRDQRAMSVD